MGTRVARKCRSAGDTSALLRAQDSAAQLQPIRTNAARRVRSPGRARGKGGLVPMKYALLVALREYAESTKAKGFWISIFLMPAMLFLSIQAPIWLEQKATPVRYYVLVDQSKTLAPAIEIALEKNYQRRVLEAPGDYSRRYSVPQSNSSSSNPLGWDSDGEANPRP